ncbi:MND1-interacting protein 1 [Hordeum vulgare]|nr:MND1-interacting protein 1 [Hordeum vulgare]
MNDLMPSKQASKDKPTAPKARPKAPNPVAPRPKRNKRDIPATEKYNGSASRDVAEEEEENVALRKLRPHLPELNDDHPVVEDMKKRKDHGLGKWRVVDPYAIKRRTTVDARFHTKDRQLLT